MRFRRAEKSEEPEINLIPLIDVVLVIIIFLMLTTTFTKTGGLEINLPMAASSDAATVSNEIVVAITAAGDVIINQQPVADRRIEALAAALGKAVPSGQQNPVVVISADAKAAHQSVIDVMQAAQRAGLAHITFATQLTSP